MRFLLFASSTLLIVITTFYLAAAQPSRPSSKSCEVVRVAGPIRRVLTEGATRRVALFDLATYDANLLLPEPKTQYSNLMRPGTWVVVVACTCEHDIYVLSMRRGRRFSDKDNIPSNPVCPN